MLGISFEGILNTVTEVFVTQTIYNSRCLQGRRVYFFIQNASTSFAQKQYCLSVLMYEADPEDAVFR